MANAKNNWLIGLVSATTLAGAMLWESKSNAPYTPIPGDVATVCYGETHVTMRRYTDVECTAMLKASLPEYGDGVLKCINVPITSNEHAAYTLFAYNEGVGLFCGSSIVKTLNAGNHRQACKLIATRPDGTPAFSYSGGKYIQGLQNRRKYESNICLKELA